MVMKEIGAFFAVLTGKKRWEKERSKLIVYPTGTVINTWESPPGHTIRFNRFEDRTIIGTCTSPMLQVGDELRWIMKSNRIGRFLIAEIKYTNAPAYVFHGKVADLGYVTNKVSSTPDTVSSTRVRGIY